jgi:hypothetical protein
LQVQQNTAKKHIPPLSFLSQITVSFRLGWHSEIDEIRQKITRKDESVLQGMLPITCGYLSPLFSSPIISLDTFVGIKQDSSSCSLLQLSRVIGRHSRHAGKRDWILQCRGNDSVTTCCKMHERSHTTWSQ